MAIFCLSVVIVGFLFSMGQRFLTNTDKVHLSHTMEVPTAEPQFSYVAVEVLNGCGISGLAQRFTNYLRKEGIDVIYTGNADRMDYAITHVIQRVDDPAKIQDALDVLSLDAARIIRQENASQHVDLTIIVGRDYEELDIYPQVMAIDESQEM